jgi:hypothetical protein
VFKKSVFLKFQALHPGDGASVKCPILIPFRPLIFLPSNSKRKIISANSHDHSPLSAIKQKVYIPRATDSLATVPEAITYCRRFIYVSSE